MNILYLALDIDLSDVSGDAIHVREATRALANLGVETHLVVQAKHGKLGGSLMESGVFVHTIPPARDLRIGWACRKLALELGPDVIFERRFSPKIGVMVSRTCGLPLILEINGLPEVEKKILGRLNGDSRALATLKFMVRKLLFSYVHRIVVVTPGLAEVMASQYDIPRGHIAVVPNGADVNAFRPGDPKIAKESVGVSPNRPVVGFVGTLYRWHGLHYLMAAASKVVQHRPDVLFSIVGDGPERQALENEVEDLGLTRNFQFVGRKDHGEIPVYIRSFDVCILPVATELFSVKYGSSALKLYEYMACGRPIVAARYPGFEVIEQSTCGILIDPRDSQEFSSALLTLIGDKAMRAAMGHRAREISVERYSWEAAARQLLKVMHEVRPKLSGTKVIR